MKTTPFIYILLFISFISCSTLFGQNRVSGIVEEKNYTNTKIEQALIFNQKNGQYCYSNIIGYFYIQANPGDTLLITHPSYIQKIIIVHSSNQFIPLELEKSPHMLDNVTISKTLTPSQLDSIETYNIYKRKIEEEDIKLKATVFNFKDPKVDNILEVQSILSYPASLVSKKHKRAKRFKKIFRKTEQEKYVRALITIPFLTSITSEKDSTILQQFIYEMPINYDTIKNFSDIELNTYSKKIYLRWKENRIEKIQEELHIN